MSVADVTVVIPNYNRTALLGRALRSIMSQTCKPSEVIVIDDCSTPEQFSEVREIVASVQPNINVRLWRNDKNRGANYSRNQGIFKASSRYISFLDSDDFWLPKKLEMQLAAIAKVNIDNSKPILSATGRYRVDASGEIIARQFGAKALTASKIRQSNSLGTLSSIIVETWIAKHIHGFDETLPACQDWDFFIRLSSYVQYVGIPEPLCIYVDHDEERITLDNKKRLKAHIFIYKKYIKSLGDMSTISRGEFYRNIAEDYQELGNPRKAAQFFSKHMALSKTNGRIISHLIPSGFWHLYYRWRALPPIKKQRYARYGRSIAEALKDSAHRIEIERDRDLIKQIISSSSPSIDR